MSKLNEKDWISGLSEEDLTFVKRFLLASGSLKELARSYGITYPTIRLRLNRLIEKIKVYESTVHRSDFERKARGLFADGKIDAETMKQLLETHYEELQNESQKAD
ncbi:MAG: DUF2089 family protein [Verrucomicrobiota bacterium]